MIPMSRNKRVLKNFEKRGLHLFHGSDNGTIKIFRPRQAYNFATGKEKKDGKPAVYATPSLDIAIFMAIFSATNMPQGLDSMYEKRKGKTLFFVSRKTKMQLKNSTAGYVYLFDKDDFKQKESGLSEWIRHTSVKPLTKFKITAHDLPRSIRIMPSKKR